jgi:hypothetical protein
MKKYLLLHFPLFTTIGFAPLIAIYALLIPGLAFAALSPSSSRLFFSGLAVGLSIYLVLVLAACFVLFKRSRTWLKKSLALYGGWLFLAAAPVFLLIAGVSGASMAVVDGSITGVELAAAQASASLRTLLMAHVVMLPWAAGAAWLLKYLGIGEM